MVLLIHTPTRAVRRRRSCSCSGASSCGCVGHWWSLWGTSRCCSAGAFSNMGPFWAHRGPRWDCQTVLAVVSTVTSGGGSVVLHSHSQVWHSTNCRTIFVACTFQLPLQTMAHGLPRRDGLPHTHCAAAHGGAFDCRRQSLWRQSPQCAVHSAARRDASGVLFC